MRRKFASVSASVVLAFGGYAAPVIVSPADYSQVSTLSLSFKEIMEDGSLGPDGKFALNAQGKLAWSNPYFGYTDYGKDNSKRVAQRLMSHANSLPVALKWSNSSGECTVRLWRTRKDTGDKPQFTVSTTGNSAVFYDLEIGRNYTWTVTDGTGTATGHFFTMNESQAPRILLYDHDPDSSGADTSNTRDIGGYRTYTGGKVVRQGRIYRTAELEWCNPVDESGIRQELTYLKNTIGIKLDLDFRNHADLTSTTKLGYAGSSSKWKWAWKNGSYLNLNESNIGAGVPRLNVNKATGIQFGAYTTLVPKKSGTTTANKNNRKNVWFAFTNIADSAKWPLMFHCSHGKDRAGTFALVVHGALGVPKKTALKDFAYSWFDSPDEILNPAGIAGTITNLFSYTSYSSGNDADYRFQEQCRNFLVQCGVDAGLTEADAKAKVTAFQEAMTEDAEEPDVNPALAAERETDGDTFSYTSIFFRRNSGGGSLGSDNGSKLSYIYTTPTTTSTHASIGDLNNYNTCLCFWPVAALPYSTPVCGYSKVGKFVTSGRYSPSSVGPYNFKMYFTGEGHSVADRTVIEHRSGVGDYTNVDLYFTAYDSSKLGEKNINASYVFTGNAAIEVWANSTLRVRDIRDMSQKRTTKGYKAYLKFPKGSCDNARFEALEIDGDGENLLGWFTGGEAGSRQYLKVSKSMLQFNAPGKTSGVAGALGLEFSLGSVNTTSSAAMLKVAGTLNVNAGSSITVDAGGKSAGTYRLISAGTLNDNANLTVNSSVENCADGCYGVVVHEGNAINLVIAEGEAPDANLDDIGDEDEGFWGYKVKGLGALGNETAIVFTNHAKAVTWTVPANLENVRFLVVGGGGGGGADTHDSNTHGGGGGGGGGVVTGLVDFAENSIVTVNIGAGGGGGVRSTRGGAGNKYGAAYSGKASCISVDGAEYVWAAGGGGDNGADSSTNAALTKGNAGNDGGSSAGSRPGQTSRGAVVAPRVASVSSIKYADMSFGRQGGAGYSGSETFYGYYSAAGGGGGAVTEGETASGSQSAGRGGEGLSSDITGTVRVYGSGGGGGAVAGGCGALGGTGAGCGNTSDVTDANCALYLNAADNQGGGGGGGGRTIPGGNGGSGIVVLRYVDAAVTPEVPDNPEQPGGDTPAAGGAVATNAMSDASWGYIVSGLGCNRNETAVVFTNENATAMTWTVPQNLQNVQFLVVGGGGGGGGDVKANDGTQGGAGGGGGGVVTGIVYRLEKGATVAVSVGAGGAGGEAANKTGSGSNVAYGAAKLGSLSSFSVDGSLYVRANAGGRDLGSKNQLTTGGKYGGYGGSCAGNRPKVETLQEPTKGSIGDGVAAMLSAEPFGNKGGASTVLYASGGGGGATEAGSPAASQSQGGDGGEGLLSDITGTAEVYGSGGGGGTAVTGGVGGKGGTNAGAGHLTSNANGEDAVANRGGGGGGGGGQSDGGAGGSGIVVFRYAEERILPRVGDSDAAVETDKVFDFARVSKPIYYPSRPVLLDSEGSQQIVFCGCTVDVPAYYTAVLAETSGEFEVSLQLNDRARPAIADGEGDEAPAKALKIEDGVVKIHIENVHQELYYRLERATAIGAGANWSAISAWQQSGDFSAALGSDLAAFYRVAVADEPSAGD